MAVHQLDPNVARHIELFSEIRLRALRADPAAFGSNYEREAAFNDTDWRARLASFAGHPGAVFALDSSADDGRQIEPVGPLIGIVGVGLTEPDDAAIWGMWVAPAGRRRGTAGQLLDAAERWATDSGAQTATLWVHRTNESAKAVYAGRGYQLVGTEDLPAEVSPACNDEMCMRLRLALKSGIRESSTKRAGRAS